MGLRFVYRNASEVHRQIHRSRLSGWIPMRNRSLKRVCLFIFFLYLAVLLSFLGITHRDRSTPVETHSASIVEALGFFIAGGLHFPDGRMTLPEISYVASVLGRCPVGCNLLVFGLSYETIVWRAINHRGHTIFVDQNYWWVYFLESSFPGIEAYDVYFGGDGGGVDRSQLSDAIRNYTSRVECRPVQDLLWSECELAINDMPNHVYDVAWDVILVDGPRLAGENETAAGPAPAATRMSSIFTAAVMARSKRGGAGGGTHVLVHDFGREAVRVCGEEFLCMENLVGVTDTLAHFVVGKSYDGSFCSSSSSGADL